MAKHRGKRVHRQSTSPEEDAVSSDENKPRNQHLAKKVENLRTCFTARLSSTQFILATLSFSIAVYLLMQNSSVLHQWKPERKQTSKDHFGRLTDHQYVSAHPDGISWPGKVKTANALRNVPKVQPHGDGGWRNASKQVWSAMFTDRCDVVRKSSKNINLKKFQDQYQNKKPLLIRFSGGADRWIDPAPWNYTNLLRSFANWEEKVEQGRRQANGQGFRTHLSTFEEYVQGLDGTGTSPKDATFSFDPNFYEHSSLYLSLSPPDYLNSSFYDSRNSVIFDSSMTPGLFHRRTDGWNGLVYGQRRWFLYPATQTPPGGPAIDVLDWYLRIRPRLHANEMPTELIQEPGDILYIPDSWYHASISIGDTIAVGFHKKECQTRMSNLTRQIDSIRLDPSIAETNKIEATLPLWLELQAAYPTNTEVLNRLGEMHAARREMNEAVKVIDKALEVDPFFLDAYINLAKIYFAVEDFVTAEEYLKLAADINPHSYDVCRIYGEFLVSRKRINEAVHMFQTGALFHPGKSGFFDYLIKEAQKSAFQ